MVLINPEKSIIREANLSPFHGLDLIRIFSGKPHTKAEILSSCHERANNCVFPKNCIILKIICPLTLILQGGIAFFVVFSTIFRIFWKTARNGKKCATLPDLKKYSGFPEKSIIWSNKLACFHETSRRRMFSGKPHDLSFELLSSRSVGFICYVLRKNEEFGFRNNCLVIM